MFVKPQYRPGVNKRDTSLANEGGLTDSDRVRFRDNRIQPIGGWQVQTVQQISGKARATHVWRTLEGRPVQAFGTNTGLYAFVGGALTDITGPIHETVLNNCFTTENGSPVVTVYLPFHLLNAGDTVIFANHQTTVGGLTIQGTYTVTEVLTSGTFTITHGSNASSTVSTPAGGYVDFKAALPVQLEDMPVSGYGTGPYGAGTYGAGVDILAEMGNWSLDNWGENLIANPTGYGVWEWQPERSYSELVFNGSFTGNANGWALGTGWSYSSNTIAATSGTASNASQNVENVLEGGRTYRVVFTVTRSAGTLKFRMNAGATPAVIDVDTASSPITKSGTYSRIFVCPADPVDFVFEKDSSFIGSLDNVSITLESKAYRLTTAPARVDAMFTDPRGVVIALGTTDITGKYSPTTVRTSALGNNRLWVPDTDNVASELTLRGIGGRLMQGIATAEQSLVWGDDGVISLQWTGTVGAAYTPQLLGTKCGVISRHSAVEQNGYVAWMSNTRQFFIFRGVSSFSLGKPETMICPIQEDVFENLNTAQQMKCYAGANPEFTEFWFFYPDDRDDTNENSRCAVVEWTNNLWMGHTIARTAWQSSGIYGNPIGYGVDQYVYTHESGRTANGGLLGAYYETSALDDNDGDNLFIFQGIIPDFEDQSGDIEYTIYHRNYPNEAWRESPAQTATPTKRRVNFKYKGREFKVRTTWATVGGWGRVGAERYDIVKTQARK